MAFLEVSWSHFTVKFLPMNLFKMLSKPILLHFKGYDNNANLATQKFYDPTAVGYPRLQSKNRECYILYICIIYHYRRDGHRLTMPIPSFSNLPIIVFMSRCS